MSVKVKKELLENLKRAEQMHEAMFDKAGEMIEMMKTVRRDAWKRKYQYRKMIRAMEQGRAKEAKQLFAEMQTWKRYKINI